jgi:hypothetical protein
MSRAVSLAAFAACLALAAPARAKDSWAVPPYDNNGLNIDAKEVVVKAGKIWFKLNFVNNTGKELGINPDQFQLKTPDGRTATRVKGMLDSRAHGAKIVPPGAGERLDFEFLINDGNKKATLSLANGLTVGGKPVKFPDLVALPGDAEWSAGAYSHNNVTIRVKSASMNKEDIEMELNFMNNSEAPIAIDKDAFHVTLPDGSTVDREKGLADKFKKAVSVIAAHRSDDVSLSFKVGHPAKVKLQMTGVNAGALNLPDLVLSPK